jgi:hypothetical protein
MAVFPIAPTSAEYKLDAQKRINSLAVENGMTVRVLDWVLDGKVDLTGVKFARARIQMRGELRQVAHMHAALEGALPNLVVRDFRINADYPAPGADETPTNLVMTADFYFVESGG